VKGSVLLIGFGRFGQLVSQCLLAQGTDVTALDNDAGMIQSASRFGFKVYYGDGTRLDVLRAAGVNGARVVAICVDKPGDADRMVALVRAECPGAKLFVRSFDRAHTLKLIRAGVDYELRETYESALAFGKRTLVELGVDEEEAQAVQDDVRRRDLERLALQQAEGQLTAGIDLIKRPRPEPLRAPVRQSRPLNADADDIINSETEFSG
jgi:glutathione-regulated potassium-efflux system protein KefB